MSVIMFKGCTTLTKPSINTVCMCGCGTDMGVCARAYACVRVCVPACMRLHVHA